MASSKFTAPSIEKHVCDYITNLEANETKPKRFYGETINKSSIHYQKFAWDILENSIESLISNVHFGADIEKIKNNLLKLNLVRGKGLFCRSIIRAQSHSFQNTRSYAYLVSLINPSFPKLGELLLIRLICQLKVAYKTDNLYLTSAAVAFIAHLINYDCVSVDVAVELLKILIMPPTLNSLDLVFTILMVCGYKINEVNKIEMENIRNIMCNLYHKKNIDGETKYMLGVILNMINVNVFKKHVQRRNFKPDDYQIAHFVSLNESIHPNYTMDIFHYDLEYETNEHLYKLFCEQILGIKNMDETYILIYDYDYDEYDDKMSELLDNNLKSLRNRINCIINEPYFSYTRTADEFIRTKLKPGREMEFCYMLFNLSYEHDLYPVNIGYIAQIFCQINKFLIKQFEAIFYDSYTILKTFDFAKLRHYAKLFAHLLASDTISWKVLSTIQLSLNDFRLTVHIYVQLLFLELIEHLGYDKLSARINDKYIQKAFEGFFPINDQENLRHSLHFFTIIGMSELFDRFRNYLVVIPEKLSIE